MSKPAREVIADTIIASMRERFPESDADDVVEGAHDVLRALTAAGYVLCGTATHAVVPTKLSNAMVDEIWTQIGIERAPAVWFWRCALAAAEAEANDKLR